VNDTKERAITAANIIMKLNFAHPQLDQVARLVLAAMEYEREACARVADEHECMAACLDYKCDQQIAAAIRARRTE
jgi:hypothetical protein